LAKLEIEINAMKRILFLSLFFTCLTLSAQTVTGVDANQVGKTIEITYDLDRTANISLDYSTDGGRTYTTLRHVSGDVGMSITPGHKTITWDVLSEVDKFVGDNICFRVNATSGKMLITLPTGQSFTMIYVEGGSFVMGCTSEQSDCYYDERPTHRVMLDSYYIGETEVTQELWRAVMGDNPSYFRGDETKLPVEKVSWEDCQLFINKLNQLTGKNFRLPTEAEWEYAARGGKKSKSYKYNGSNTIDNVAWYDDNSGNQTHNVKTKLPNELGIYDMSGNVWEWCQDWYGSGYYANSPQANPTGPSSGSDRVFRGGSWNRYARNCRVALRNSNTPSSRGSRSGFRLILVQ
jgi:formylglycine-generating enzyme required for sulfatase activity